MQRIRIGLLLQGEISKGQGECAPKDSIKLQFYIVWFRVGYVDCALRFQRASVM